VRLYELEVCFHHLVAPLPGLEVVLGLGHGVHSQKLLEQVGPFLQKTLILIFIKKNHHGSRCLAARVQGPLERRAYAE